MKKNKDIQYYEAVGRRKEAVARVRLYIVGKDKTAMVGDKKIRQGEIFVNNKIATEQFPMAVHKARYLTPLEITETTQRFAVSVIVKGGGINGQIDAMVHGLARVLEKVDKETYRPTLKKASLLTRDPRARERRKVGTGGKARRQKQSPKR